MSNPAFFLIRNDFHEVDNHEACMEYLNRTMQFVRDYFGEDWVVSQDEEDIIEGDRYEFWIEPLYVRMELHDGFWIGDSLISYWYYFMPDKDGRAWLREANFDLCRMFSMEDGYAFDWPVYECLYDLKDKSLEAWTEEERKSRVSGCTEYDAAFWKKEENLEWKNIKHCYHDSFVECKEILQGYQRDFPGYDILSIRLRGNFIFGRKDGMLYLLDTKTRKPFNKSRLESVGYREEGVEIHTDGTRFLFDYDGNPVTEAEHS